MVNMGKNSDYAIKANVSFEVSTAVLMKIAVFWDVKSCSSCKIRCYISPKTLVLTRATGCNIPEDGILFIGLYLSC
jgi:hypothetical protein